MATTQIPKSKAANAYELLTEVRALIIAEPKRYDQSCYIDRGRSSSDHRVFPSCGTVGCVAGWVATLKLKRKFGYFETSDVAGRILGLDYYQRHELFNGGAVPETLRPQTRKHAVAGARHIAAFQKSNRAQLLKTKV